MPSQPSQSNPDRRLVQLREQCLAIDLETTHEGRLFRVGAVYGDQTLDRTARDDGSSLIRELDKFGADAGLIVGHNLLDHDLAVIHQLNPASTVLQRPVIDTLLLSPLAFPENPYHALIKDYKLVRDAVNNPVADARLAMTVLHDEWQALSRVAAHRPELLDLYRACFAGGLDDRGGFDMLFEALGAAAPAGVDLSQTFIAIAEGRTCPAQVQQLIAQGLDGSDRLALGYVAAWLTVAGGNSVLPPWVRHRFPATVSMLRRLRDTFCGDRTCAYCSVTHSATAQLKHTFGFDSFRPKPVARDGRSLQEKIVEAGLGDRPLLAILPTGGGKSLCFQVPAMARYARRGVLTIVVSPLQALMKDQVDNFQEKTGSPATAALYGMLTPPERGDVLERLRMGDIGLLYVSPEQLRNRSFRNAVAQREIGAWVFDEAHCLSKWGHDFRPDYLYASRFIRELAESQKAPIPSVACFTATAKLDVVAEIRRHFKEELGQELELFAGEPRRDNLRFEVQPVSMAEKLSRIANLLIERVGEKGSGLVYVATRRRAEEIAGYLAQQGLAAKPFHAGLDTPLKRDTQEQFLAGQIKIIVATNAFGMGIDKADVRLVIHADIPGSLENYLQEAGRAGRDQQASDCVLLFCEEDIERQFQLTAYSQLTRRDIAQILRGLRRARRKCDSVTITSGELLRDEEVVTGFDTRDASADTKVKTAIAWLENARFVQRNENQTAIWQGRPIVGSLIEAIQKLDLLGLSDRIKRHWRAIMQALINHDNPREGFTADQLMELPELSDAIPTADQSDGSQYVLRTLRDMENRGLVKQTLMLTAFVRHKVANSSIQRLEEAARVENAMLDWMQELAPDAEDGQWQVLSLAETSLHLRQQGFECSVPLLRSLLMALRHDGRATGEGFGSVEFRHVGSDRYQFKLRRSWEQIRQLSQLRIDAATVVLQTITDKIADPQARGADLLVEFSADDLIGALEKDMVIRSRMRDFIDAVRRTLIYLHDLKVIVMQHGLAVFRQAMTIDVLPESKGRSYTRADFAPLEQHYAEQVLQIHVMAEYAKRGIDDVTDALRLVLAYFTMSQDDFVKRYFAGRERMLERAVTQEAYRRIVEDLNNPHQAAIVSATEDANMLVLAGPGSGKTRTIVHRVAYLLQVKRTPPRSILVLCFNHLAMLQLRERLRQLVGAQASRVTILTYHGLAMRLTGTPPSAFHERQGQPNFDELIRSATQLLQGQTDLPGLEADEVRDRLLEGYRHVLVDEYQDIDEDQYALISAIAGRSLQDEDSKLTILAVGDDDQSIYAFRGSNVRFIRKFQEDYQARCRYLVDNYRSTAHIIDASNQLISINRDRMKIDHPIQIDATRRKQPPGGVYERLDAVSRGRVQIVQPASNVPEAMAIVDELVRQHRIAEDQNWSGWAVLAPTREQLARIRAACTALAIPVRLMIADIPKLHRIREIAAVLDALHDRRDEVLPVATIRESVGRALADQPFNIWRRKVECLITAWDDDSQGAHDRPVAELIDHLYRSLAEERREQRYGDGVLLSTIHAAKGTEHDHVLVAGDGWHDEHAAAKQEEQRRTFYVGMTRARLLLTLFDGCNQKHPHLRHLSGKPLLERVATTSAVPIEPSLLERRYTVLGLDELNIGYASMFDASHPIHHALQQLTCGDDVRLVRQNSGVVIADGAGCVVGRLSVRGAQTWGEHLDQIIKVTVLAMLRQTVDSSKPEYSDRARVPTWDLPLIEVTHRPL